MAMAMATGMASAAELDACSHTNCAGGDIPSANPVPGFSGDRASCSLLCNKTVSCVAYVYDECVAATPTCYLKANLLKSHCTANHCTCTASNGRQPLPPPCNTCVSTKGWVGGEWKPANASNALWWSPDFFDGYCCGPGSQVDQAFAATAAAGLTAARVWLHDMAYDADPQAFLKNVEAFLVVAAKYNIGIGFVFFDDCWAHKGASTSVQCTPIPGQCSFDLVSLPLVSHTTAARPMRF